MKQDKQRALDRLALLEGQVRGIARMVGEDRYCMDTPAQTAAVPSALGGVERLVLENHARHCVEDVIGSGDPEVRRWKFREPTVLLQKTRER